MEQTSLNKRLPLRHAACFIVCGCRLFLTSCHYKMLKGGMNWEVLQTIVNDCVHTLGRLMPMTV